MARTMRAEEKRIEFEKSRDYQRKLAADKAMRKTQDMQQALLMSEKKQEERKQQILLQ